MYNRIAVVTGGNKGVGLGIVRQLAIQYPKSSFNNGPLLIYLTARDKGRGEVAVKELFADSQLEQAKALSKDGGQTDIKYAELDIDSVDSIHKLANFLHSKHPDGIDFVINNAGIAMNGFDENVVRQTVHTNYYGTLEACQAFLPLIRSGGRLVNVSSTVSTIGKYGAALQDKFKAASTVSDVSALMEDFKQSAADGTLEQHGWTAAAYAASKAGVTTVTRVLALEEAAKGRGILVNSCCPGWVQTDMTKGKGQKTLDQGATTPVFLAFGDLEGRHGLFWRDEHPISEVNSSMPS